jgi:hypothetical protein
MLWLPKSPSLAPSSQRQKPIIRWVDFVADAADKDQWRAKALGAANKAGSEFEAA